MKKMNTFKWRSECPVDDERLLACLPQEQIVKYKSVRHGQFPDCVSELTVRSLTLDELRQIMRNVPDGHVMLQTVQPKALYTGERKQEP